MSRRNRNSVLLDAWSDPIEDGGWPREGLLLVSLTRYADCAGGLPGLDRLFSSRGRRIFCRRLIRWADVPDKAATGDDCEEKRPR